MDCYHDAAERAEVRRINWHTVATGAGLLAFWAAVAWVFLP